MSIKAVIFDLGGVLVRTESQQSRQDLAVRLNRTPEELYQLIFDSPTASQATLGQVTAREHWSSVGGVLQMTEAQVEDVRRSFFAGDHLDKALVDYIRSLRPRYQTALLSNAWDDLRSLLGKTWNILEAFDEIVISAEVGIAKPDARVYQLLIERLNIPPEQAVFVDDFVRNIEAADRIGLKTVWFRNRAQAIADLEKILADQD
jgi:glucose-1-phosphatase